MPFLYTKDILIFLFVLIAFTWILEGSFKRKWEILKSNTLAKIFLSFYIVHILGMLYTTDFSAGLFDLQVKLSFLLFPVIISTIKITSRQFNIIKNAFIISCMAVFFICVGTALYKYFFKGIAEFSYEKFACNHASGLSITKY